MTWRPLQEHFPRNDASACVRASPNRLDRFLISIYGSIFEEYSSHSRLNPISTYKQMTRSLRAIQEFQVNTVQMLGIRDKFTGEVQASVC
jgi:hypothetical protein